MALKAMALSVPAELRNQAIAYKVPSGFFLGAGLAPLIFGALGMPDFSSLRLSAWDAC